jgi:hypothetical protein
MLSRETNIADDLLDFFRGFFRKAANHQSDYQIHDRTHGPDPLW